jgi:5-methylcytosine-specific restriction endonuclease McrA
VPTPEKKARARLLRQRQYAREPEKFKARVAKRDALKRGASTAAAVRLLDIAIRDHWTCHICHKKVTEADWSLDHLIPLSKGGAHTPANVALAHRRCNSRRGVGKIAAQLRLF